MAVSASAIAQYAPISNVKVYGGEAPIARFAGLVGAAGDGSGGAVSLSMYLNDVSASPSNSNIWYVITELFVVVTNTGTATKACVYTNSTNTDLMFQSQSTTFVNVLKSGLLYDDGTYNSLHVYDQAMVIGHSIQDTDFIVGCGFDVNTNTKNYYFFVRGLQFKGYPVIKQGNFWI